MPGGPEADLLIRMCLHPGSAEVGRDQSGYVDQNFPRGRFPGQRMQGHRVLPSLFQSPGRFPGRYELFQVIPQRLPEVEGHIDLLQVKPGLFIQTKDPEFEISS